MSDCLRHPANTLYCQDSTDVSTSPSVTEMCWANYMGLAFLSFLMDARLLWNKGKDWLRPGASAFPSAWLNFRHAPSSFQMPDLFLRAFTPQKICNCKYKSFQKLLASLTTQEYPSQRPESHPSEMQSLRQIKTLSLRTSHPRLLPQSPKVCSVHMCLFFCFAYRIIITIFFKFHIYALVYCNGLYLSGLLHSV